MCWTVIRQIRFEKQNLRTTEQVGIFLANSSSSSDRGFITPRGSSSPFCPRNGGRRKEDRAYAIGGGGAFICMCNNHPSFLPLLRPHLSPLSKGGPLLLFFLLSKIRVRTCFPAFSHFLRFLWNILIYASRSRFAGCRCFQSKNIFVEVSLPRKDRIEVFIYSDFCCTSVIFVHSRVGGGEK